MIMSSSNFILKYLFPFHPSNLQNNELQSYIMCFQSQTPRRYHKTSMLLKSIFFICSSHMTWKSEGFWILSEKDRETFGKNVVLWLHHVHVKSTGFCKTSLSMNRVLWTHKTSNLRLSFRVLDMLQTFLLSCFGRTHQHFCSLTKIPRPSEQRFHVLKFCQYCLFCPTENTV